MRAQVKDGIMENSIFDKKTCCFSVTKKEKGGKGI